MITFAKMDAKPGSRIGPYEILAPLGAGGMGEVYRAKDPKLNREIALKILPAQFAGDGDAVSRFEREAQAIAALSHRNLVTVHDAGRVDETYYIAMELVEGKSLRALLAEGPPPLRKALQIATEVAEGLAAAHEKGIIHRDLKPENLMVTRDGHVKILDFGLAKLVQPEPAGTADTDAPTLAHTKEGTVLGTVGYMSPEQVRGQAADRRSDIFAFGAILYELVTGRKAFSGESSADRLSAVLREEPAGLTEMEGTHPPALVRVIRRCLEKSPQQRFQSATDLAFALEEASGHGTVGPAAARTGSGAWKRWWLPAAGLLSLLVLALALNFGDRFKRRVGAGAPARVESIAVLPLRNVSGNAEQDYLAEGLTDGLIAKLAEIRALRVISRTSTMQYKESKKTLPEVARELGVDGIVEGSVARAGDRVQVTARLIHAKTDAHVWAKSYSRSIGETFALQNDVARAIADAIDVAVTAQERARLGAPPARDARAQEAFLKGSFFMEQGTPEALQKAYDHWRRALEIDPSHAAAHAGIARYWSSLPFYTSISPAETLPKARSAAMRALELDDQLPEAHAALAYIRAYYEWDWAAAEQEYRRALDLRPNSADVHFSYSRFLAARGRLDEAVTEIHRAQALDPLSLLLRANTALLFYFGGRYEKALAELQKIRQADPGFAVAHWGAGLVFEQQKKLPEAIAAFEKARSLSKSANFAASLGHAYALAKRPREAQAILDELSQRAKGSYVPSYYFAIVHVGLGQRDPALQWLNRAYQERSTVLAYLQVDPRLTPLRGDPQFEEVLRRIGMRGAEKNGLAIEGDAPAVARDP